MSKSNLGYTGDRPLKCSEIVVQLDIIDASILVDHFGQFI